MNSLASDLLKREMSRKDFLKLAGFGVLSIFGFGTILKLLGSMHEPATTHTGQHASRPKGRV